MAAARVLSRGKAIPRTDSTFRTSTGNIAAIDFGTTYCSLSYKTAGDDCITNFKFSDTHTRIPNAILLKKQGDKLEVERFGYRAQDEYTRIRQSQRDLFLYFERVKMVLERKEINRSTVVCDFSGKEFYLVEVIGFMLKHLKSLLIERLQMTGKPLKETDFDWVITVPAIWHAGGKQMMREASYLGGLLSDASGIEVLTDVGRDISRPQVDNPDKLSLALEPEVAAIYCQHMTKDHIADFCGTSLPVKAADNYVVLDIGGGTVDITAQHKEGVTDSLEVLSTPSGSNYGGTQINEEFSELLQKIVKDKNFSRLKSPSNPGETGRHQAMLNQLLYKEFEEEKVAFGERCTNEISSSTHKDDTDEMRIQLPALFIRTYSTELIERGIRDLQDDRIEFDDDTLYLKYGKAKELFKPAVLNIIHSIKSVMSNLTCKVDVIYLVGGFGGCKYMYHVIKQSLPTDIPLVVPKEHKIAVVAGATMWRSDPSLITSRRADATYGISVSKPYREEIHDPYYMFVNEEGQKRCNKVFEVYLQKGEIAKSDQVFTNTITPSRQNRSSMSFDLYCTPNTHVQYIVDKNGCPTVSKIGNLSIDIPNPDNLARRDRKVELTWDFSGTEIQVRACYLVTGSQVKCAVDFLSAHSTT
jgi:hypothetical protein